MFKLPTNKKCKKRLMLLNWKANLETLKAKEVVHFPCELRIYN